MEYYEILGGIYSKRKVKDRWFRDSIITLAAIAVVFIVFFALCSGLYCSAMIYHIKAY